MIRVARLVMVLLAGVIGPPDISAQINPTDLPPSPFSLPAATEPQSASYTRDAGRALELHAATTNAAVKKLLGEIRDLNQKLSVLEQDAFQKVPLLLTCDQYIEKAHDWVMATHHAEMEAEAKFFGGSTNQVQAGQIRKLENDLSHLMNLILLKELGGNTNFAPLIKSVFDNLEMLRQMNTNSVAHPEQQYYPYWQTDRVIGYPQTNRPVRTNSFAEIQSELGKRYDLLLAKVAQIQREQNIPPDAVAGVKYGYLYRMLDGAAEMYLDCRTPPEVRKLREELSRKFVELSWLDK
jgi:hypothetical protein